MEQRFFSPASGANPQQPDLIQTFINQEIKAGNCPNLFSALAINDPKLGQGLISAEALITLVDSIIADYIEQLKQKSLTFTGDGSKSNPYILVSPPEWLMAAVNLPVAKDVKKEPQQFTYFKIGGQVITLESHARKASSGDNTVNFPPNDNNQVDDILVAAFHDLIDPATIEELQKCLRPSNFDDTQSLKDFVPLVFYLIQQANSKQSDQKANWDKPAYSLLGKAHQDSTQYVQAELEKKTAEDVTKAITAAKAAEFSGKELDEIKNWDLKGLTEKLLNPLFSKLNEPGSKQDPPDLSPEQHAAQQAGEQFKQIIGMLVEGFSANLKQQEKVSLSSVIDAIKASGEALLGDQKPNEAASAASNVEYNLDALLEVTGPVFQSLLTQKDKSDEVYAKLTQLTHLAFINQIRDLLMNRTLKATAYLPVTLAALFLAETSRYPSCFLASLALLDLMQSHQPCPDSPNEIYNVENMLKSPAANGVFTDAYGACYLNNGQGVYEAKKAELKKQISDLPDQAIVDLAKNWITTPGNTISRNSLKRNRDQDINKLVNCVFVGSVSKNVSGYHPMVQGDSYNEVKDLNKNPNNATKLNLVQQKIASILIQWLSLHLPAEPKKLFLDELPQSDLTSNNTIINDLIKSLLEKRLQSFRFIPFAENEVQQQAEEDALLEESAREVLSIG